MDKIGKVLLDSGSSKEQIASADKVLANWRVVHMYPLNTFRSTLGKRLSQLGEEINVSQRLKRRESIINKLKIDKSMRLSQMQDIGGLRAVVSSIGSLRKLESLYLKKPTKQFPHETRPTRDYITHPRDADGYRSLHLIYRYQKNVKPKEYNGLLLELQLRTKLQHYWATAVETMETFLKQPIKSRTRDPESEWVDFFRAVSSAFAHIENLPSVPRHSGMSKKEVFQKVADMDKKLHVLQQLKKFRLVADMVIKRKDKDSVYHIILLNYEKRTGQLFSYSSENLSVAKKKYAELEVQAAGGAPIDSVLVSVNSISNLRRDYPSFFLDSKQFIETVESEIINKSNSPIS